MLARLLTIIFLFFLCGCSNLNCTRLETLLGGDINLVHLGREIGDRLIEASYPPLFPRQMEQPVLLTSMVDDKNLYESSDFGRALTDSIGSRLVERGYAVKEIKLRDSLLVREGSGEFLLSRDLEEISGKQKAQAVIVGTYTLASRVLYLNVRLVNPADKSIRAAYTKKLCLDENTLEMLGLRINRDTGIRPPKESWIDRIFY